MKQLVLALQFLTRLPLPAVRADADDFARSMRWFPAAGLAVGGSVALAWWLARSVAPFMAPSMGGSIGDGWIAALCGLGAWVAVTGALHLDGLGDVADGAGAAHKDPARLSAVMADPHVGSFAVVAIGMQLLAKLVLLHALAPGQVWALLLVAPLARAAPLAWTLALPPLHEGLGSRFRSAVTWRHLALWSVIGAVAALLVAPALLAVFLAVPAWGWWLRRRIGGISGDGHGAGIEVVETLLLLALAVVR